MRHLSKLITQTGRSINNPVRNGSSVTSSFKPVSMNELPAPSGSWSEHYNAKQKVYNLQLIGGIAFTTATILFGYKSGSFYLNLGPELKNKD